MGIQHSIIDLDNCDESIIKSPAAIQDFVISLCKLLDIERVTDCDISNHEDRYYMRQFIAGGFMSGCFDAQTKKAQLDIINVHPIDIDIAIDHAEQVFRGTIENFISFDR